jgi:ubiquinone/menaquinone biosynthesis C-methylase UbiE
VHDFKEGPEHWKKRFEGPDRDASQKPGEVVGAMGLATGMRVADVGAGTGYFMKHLATAVGSEGRVLAVDIEPTMVRFLKERAADQGHANVEARLALPDDPLLASASLDRILIVNTWHHIPKRKAYAAKLYEALAEGGEVWILDFNMETERGPTRKHRLAPATVLEELKSAGFATRLNEELLPDQYAAIGKRPASSP